MHMIAHTPVAANAEHAPCTLDTPALKTMRIRTNRQEDTARRKRYMTLSHFSPNFSTAGIDEFKMRMDVNSSKCNGVSLSFAKIIMYLFVVD